MFRFLPLLVLALMLIALGTGTARACPMCSEAVPATSGADEDDAMREARAYNNSVYLMAGMPYLMLGGLSIWVYRGIRRQPLTPTPSHGSGTSLKENVSGTSTNAAGVL
jgi:hypothetical protein